MKRCTQCSSMLDDSFKFCYSCGMNLTGEINDEIASVLKYREQAERGDAQGLYMLGWCYYFGKGIAQNHAEAKRLLCKAILLGNPGAIYLFGWIYENGYGVIRDLSKAVAWYKKAAELGDAMAQFRLGACYHEGAGVQKSKALAKKWCHAAASQGQPEAMTYFMRYFLKGK